MRERVVEYHPVSERDNRDAREPMPVISGPVDKNHLARSKPTLTVQEVNIERSSLVHVAVGRLAAST